MKQQKMKNKFKKIIIGGAVGIAAAFLLSSCASKSQTSDNMLKTPDVQETQTMGTTLTITNYTPGTKAANAVKSALKIAEDYNTWVTVNQKGSVIDSINANAGIKPVKVSASILQLISDAYQLSDKNTGYDVTIGPLTQLWHIGFPDAKRPTQAEIDAVLPLINYKYLQLNPSTDTVYLTKIGAKLDLGSIAKGFTVKQIVTMLKSQGVRDAIVDMGSSSIYVMGHSPRGNNIPWNIGIKDPNNPNGENLGVVSASNQFISTSGIYERYLKVDGKTYSHILNPATGYPFDNDIQGVSIIGSDDATYGDGVSTTIFALGTKKGYDYVMAHHLQAIFIDKGNKVYVTPGLKNNFTLNSQSKYKIATMN